MILKKCTVFLGLVIFCVLVGKSWHYCKDGFSPRRVQLDFSEMRKAGTLDPHLRKALAQQYSYLSRGRQSYAFVSDDGQYVLKLPRSDSYCLPFWLRCCSFSVLDRRREEGLAARKKRLHSLMNSFSLAYEELKKETGLLYLHLGPTDHLMSRVTLRDRLGSIYELDLDQTAFVLQAKTPLMIPLFKQRLAEGDREGAKAILRAFIDFVAFRAQRGIFNKDGSFLRNFGYDGGRVIQIDIGDFYRPSSGNLDPAFSFLQTVGHVITWLGSVDLEIQAWFEQSVSERVKEFS
jgi:hypothetical protein